MKQLMIRANALDLIVIRFSLNGITLFNGISAHTRPLIVKCEEKKSSILCIARDKVKNIIISTAFVLQSTIILAKYSYCT